MRKIPTLFRRDPADMRRLTREPHPDCLWVLAGEGHATRKYDGTCVMFDGARWWARREVKPGAAAPPGWVAVDIDEHTGKASGWEPVEQSAFAKFHAEAVARFPNWAPGTYELLGPKVNGNPEGADGHRLQAHDEAERLPGVPRDYDALAAWLADFAGEGVVWHNDDGRMAKIKRKDFPSARMTPRAGAVVEGKP